MRGKIFPLGDDKVRKRLAVRQAFVELRVDILDKTALREERLPFRCADDYINLMHMLKHGLLLRTKISRRQKITRHPVRQRACLSNIQHNPLVILQ